MRAIILAAGEGRRLFPLTKDKPKCLVEYRDKPLIDYQLETLRGCGVHDMVMVRGYKSDVLYRPGLDMVENTEYDSTNMVHTLFCAENYFDDDLIITYGDIIYDKSILNALLESEHDFAVVVSTNWRELWERRMTNPLKYAETLKMNAQGLITEIGKKPKSYDDIEGQYLGLFKVSRRMMQTVKTMYGQMGQETDYDGQSYRKMYMTSLIQHLIDEGLPIHSVPVTGEWLEVDEISDLDAVCRI